MKSIDESSSTAKVVAITSRAKPIPPEPPVPFDPAFPFGPPVICTMTPSPSSGEGDGGWDLGIPTPAQLAEAERTKLEREREKEARLAKAIVEAIGQVHPTITVPTNEYTTEQLVADYITSQKTEKERAEGTYESYEDRKKPLLRLLPKYAHEIDHARLSGYVATRRGEGARAVIKKELRFLGAAWKLAYKNDRVSVPREKILPDVDSMSEPGTRFLTPEQAWLVIRWMAARSQAGKDHAACVAYAIATSAEYGAYARVVSSHLRADNMGAHVPGKKRKTRARFAPCPLPDQQALLKFARENARGVGKLFTSWSNTNANTDLTEACAALGLVPTGTKPDATNKHRLSPTICGALTRRGSGRPVFATS